MDLEVDVPVAGLQIRGIEDVDQELIMGMDFCRKWDVESKLGKGQWQTFGGRWRPFWSGTAVEKNHSFAECAGTSYKYTAFAVEGSELWKLTRMPFELTNATATFQRLIDTLFGPDFKPYIFLYLDDIIACSHFNLRGTPQVVSSQFNGNFTVHKSDIWDFSYNTKDSDQTLSALLGCEIFYPLVPVMYRAVSEG